MEDFTQGRITRQIMLFALPMLLGNVFQQLYSMADAMVVGRYVGGNALAAVGVAMTVNQFLTAVLIGLTTGASVLISQFYGAKDHDRLRRVVSTSIIFLAVLSVVIGVLGVALAPALMRLLNADPEIMDDAVLYTRILLGGMVFTVFYNMYTAYLRALGDSKGPLYILICCTLLNIVLDLIFVVVFRMDVLGVAVATIIAQMISAVLCYIHTLRNVPLLKVKKIVFDRGLFGSVIKYGAPAAVQLSLVNLASLSITRLINSFGPNAMAGITAASKIDQLAIMPVSTVSMALSTFVAQNMGAGKEDRAKKGLRTSVIMMVMLALLLSGLLLYLSPGLISMFLNPEEAATTEILTLGREYLSIIVAFYFLFAFLFAFNGFFRGAGDAVIAMVFPVTSLTIRAALAHVLVEFAGMGPEALAWSIPAGWGLCSLGSLVYYKKRCWAGKQITTKR
ncbi:MAG: MATE family efflux transporter [Clostridiales bacterium]|nr:MATE family efflux transporter [Clostridiales bacterium]